MSFFALLHRHPHQGVRADSELPKSPAEASGNASPVPLNRPRRKTVGGLFGSHSPKGLIHSRVGRGHSAEHDLHSASGLTRKSEEATAASAQTHTSIGGAGGEAGSGCDDGGQQSSNAASRRQSGAPAAGGSSAASCPNRSAVTAHESSPSHCEKTGTSQEKVGAWHLLQGPHDGSGHVVSVEKTGALGHSRGLRGRLVGVLTSPDRWPTRRSQSEGLKKPAHRGRAKSSWGMHGECAPVCAAGPGTRARSHTKTEPVGEQHSAVGKSLETGGQTDHRHLTGGAWKEHVFTSALHCALRAMKSLPSTLQREWSMVRKFYRQSGRVRHTQRLQRAREAKASPLRVVTDFTEERQARALNMKQVVPSSECANALIQLVQCNRDKSMRDFQHASPVLSLRKEQLLPCGQHFVVRCLHSGTPFITRDLTAGRLLGGGSEAMVFAADELRTVEKKDTFLGIAAATAHNEAGRHGGNLLAIKLFLCEENLLREPAKAAEEAEALEWLQMSFWRLAPQWLTVSAVKRLGIAAPCWMASIDGFPLVSPGDVHFAILNRLTAMPIMLGDLLAVPPGGLCVLDRIYLVVRLIQIVANLHAMGVLHNDLKIENLLVGVDGRLYVGDLGTVLAYTGRPVKFQRIGTDVYLDPKSAEDFLREDGDFKVVYSPLRDAWATGIICYYLWCSGGLPYDLSRAYSGAIRGRQLFEYIAGIPKSGKQLTFSGCPEEQTAEIHEVRLMITSLLAPCEHERATPLEIVGRFSLFSKYR